MDFSSPHVMGILNITPDSFSDGGRFLEPDKAVAHAVMMQSEGASIIDIGGESTRPGAAEVSEQEELDRILPIVEACVAATDVIISIDTYKPNIMRAAIAAGARMINDVKALQEPGAIDVALATNVPICLMHMLGEPRTMQQNPVYTNVLEDIGYFFQERLRVCETAGIDSQRLIVDPGFGFGKTDQQNLQLIQDLNYFQQFNLPLLIGVSRKSTIGRLLDRDVEDRLAGSLALTSLAIVGGARIIRAHDVKATADVVKLTMAVMQGSFDGYH